MDSILKQPCVYIYSASLSDLKDLSYRFLNNSLSKSEVELFQRLMAIKAVSEALEIAEEGLKKSACRFDVNYKNAFMLGLGHLSKLKKLNITYCVHAIHLMSARGDDSQKHG